MNIHVKPPLDYAPLSDDEDDDDEPYDRCPFCNAVIAAIVTMGLLLASYAIWRAIIWLL